MPKNRIGKFLYLILCLTITATYQVYGAQTIINNNYAPAPAAPAAPTQAPSPCNGNNTASNGLPPGTYTTQNGDGTSNRIYTTGDKQPYIVDNNCNPQPTIQPEIYPQMPMNGSGSGSGSTPRPSR